jgi:Cu/Ag efflux protein CusF
MRTLNSLLILAAMAAGATSAYAASHASAPMTTGDAKKEAAMVSAADMTEGEIRKIDMQSKKITIRHGEIKNLDMPGMTMVFRVRDTVLLDEFKTGDNIRFIAEKENGAIVVTDIEPAK